ncbi:MAG TPA: ATP-binding protein [Candidatus Sulfomarinibacteraceae bacterium]|nr:ATP-binding protein [Candidatus Sulfomarinibacteraceae bacterium]
MNDTRPPRVLLVDDEVDFLTSLSQRLQLRGVPTLSASNGPDALEILDRKPVDVVVLDVRMPGMDGIEALRHIKERHPRVEVVMLTGHADLDTAFEGMRFGFFDYLTKPVQLPELIAKIEDAFRRRRGEEVAGGETFTGKLQQHMIVADRLASLGELAASIAHEINNPLAVIAESAGWLRSRAARAEVGPDELRGAVSLALDKIESAIDRASRISQNFLRFARAPDAQVRDLDLGDLASEVRDLTVRTAAHADIEVAVTRPPGADLSLTSDPYQVRQVLLNLVTNAIQAIGREGRVELAVDGRPDEVSVSVVDDGPGIPPEHLERIFEPFFTTKEEGHGTGLGLAVSRGIVEKLGGRIEVDNRPGSGCTFRLVLPRSRP